LNRGVPPLVFPKKSLEPKCGVTKKDYPALSLMRPKPWGVPEWGWGLMAVPGDSGNRGKPPPLD